MPVVGHLLLDNRQVVALADVVLEEDGRAAALELAVGDDSDAVAQDVGLVHVVRRQNNRAVCKSQTAFSERQLNNNKSS